MEAQEPKLSCHCKYCVIISRSIKCLFALATTHGLVHLRSYAENTVIRCNAFILGSIRNLPYTQLPGFKNIVFKCVDFTERGRDGGRQGGRAREHQFIVPLMHHRLILLCALTGDRTHNLGASGGCSNPRAAQPGHVQSPVFPRSL